MYVVYFITEKVAIQSKHHALIHLTRGTKVNRIISAIALSIPYVVNQCSRRFELGKAAGAGNEKPHFPQAR